MQSRAVNWVGHSRLAITIWGYLKRPLSWKPWVSAKTTSTLRKSVFVNHGASGDAHAKAVQPVAKKIAVWEDGFFLFHTTFFGTKELKNKYQECQVAPLASERLGPRLSRWGNMISQNQT